MTDEAPVHARAILPEGWQRPRGYSNGMAARGELLARRRAGGPST